MPKLMSKSELIQRIADQHSNSLTRKDIKGVIESLASVGYKELKKTGAFFVPGFAKFVVINDETRPLVVPNNNSDSVLLVLYKRSEIGITANAC